MLHLKASPLTNSKSYPQDTLFVYHAETGEFLHKILVKYPNFKEVTMIVALPDKPWQVALIDQDKGNIMDVKNKKFARYNKYKFYNLEKLFRAWFMFNPKTLIRKFSLCTK